MIRATVLSFRLYRMIFIETKQISHKIELFNILMLYQTAVVSSVRDRKKRISKTRCAVSMRKRPWRVCQMIAILISW